MMMVKLMVMNSINIYGKVNLLLISVISMLIEKSPDVKFSNALLLENKNTEIITVQVTMFIVGTTSKNVHHLAQKPDLVLIYGLNPINSLK
jgi:hypothetical protein